MKGAPPLKAAGERARPTGSFSVFPRERGFFTRDVPVSLLFWACCLLLAHLWTANAVFAQTGPRYLIVTSEQLKSAFQGLAVYREAQFGVGRTGVVSVESIDASQTGDSLQDKIFGYLKTRWQTGGLEYVVLGGDDSVVPAYMQFARYDTESSAEVPSDLFYAAFGDSGHELEPSVIIGRIPVRSAEQAKAYIDKLKRYETKGKTSLAGKILLSGARLNAAYSGSERGFDMVNDGLLQFREHAPVSDAEQWCRRVYRDGAMMASPPEEVKGLFDTLSSWDASSPGDYPITAERLAEKLALGWESLIHFSTGSAVSLLLNEATGEAFTRDHAAALKGMAVSFDTTAGDSAAFDDPDDPSLAESLLRNPDGGALIYFGCSRFTKVAQADLYGGAPAYFLMRYHYRIYDGTSRTYGEAFTRAKLDMIPYATENNTEMGAAFRYLEYGLNFLGDPAIQAPARPAWAGGLVSIEAASVAGVAESFWATPKVKGAGDGVEKATLKAVSRVHEGVDIHSGDSAASASFVLPNGLPMWDRKATEENVRQGMPVARAMVRRGSMNLDMKLNVKLQSGGSIRKADAGSVRIVRPLIHTIQWLNPPSPGAGMQIDGKYFGKAIPRLYFEYRTGSNGYGWKRARLEPLPLYPDAFGKPFSSVSSPTTGEAAIYARYPEFEADETPTGWLIVVGETGVDAAQYAIIE